MAEILPIYYIQSGKYLVTIEALEEYFSTPTPSEIKPVSAARQVYKIS